jgi:hypothetical protein
MYTTTEILLIAGIKYSVYPKWKAGNVYMTRALQLIGAYKDLEAYRAYDRDYAGWHAHHVVEFDDLDRLGVQNHAPAYNDQLCVLLPERAHIGRISGTLRRENPTRYQATAKELRAAYAKVYDLVGDYCGGGEAKIRGELMAIVKAEFQKLGIAP